MTRNTSLALSTSRDTLAATPMPRIPCLGLGVPPACPDALALTRSASCSAHFQFSTRAAAHTKEKHFPRASRADVRPFARFRRGSSRRLLGEAVGRFSLKDDNAAVLRLSLRRPQSAAAHHTKYNIRATHWSLEFLADKKRDNTTSDLDATHASGLVSRTCWLASSRAPERFGKLYVPTRLLSAFCVWR
jgi:hypothetical protein